MGYIEIIKALEKMIGEKIWISDESSFKKYDRGICKYVLDNEKAQVIQLKLCGIPLKELPESITALTNLQSLDLSGTQISELPESITALTNLQSLDLSGTQISELPESITALTNLQSLDLRETQISELPESITALTNLQSLGLSGTQISELPESITALTNLQSLDLSWTRISELPESITALTNLQSLYLSGTQISELPESITALTNLQSLNLSGANISELPESISALTNLQSLDLSRTEISELPESITALTNLQSLFLSETQISKLPESITALTSLKLLDLRNTQIRELPESITALTSLQSLDLGDTKIRELPESITALTNLQSLSLSRTKISELPKSITALTNLQSLDLSGTQIRELPESITALTNLQSLNLSGTQISKLPESITALTNLQSLSLIGTQIRELPESISALTNLQSLSLRDTQISELPESITALTNLQSLYLRGTKISELPESITALTNLQSLYLSGTQIGELPESITALTNLQSLDLNRTQISELPESISALTNLQSLDLRNTKIRELPESITALTNLQSLYLVGTQINNFPKIVIKLGLSFNTRLQYFIDNKKGIFIGGMKFTDVPMEVIEQGKQFIEDYLMSKKNRCLNEIKIILIGDGASGKTSLVKKLCDEPFDPQELTTHGISIKDKVFNSYGKAITAHIWDFGGQEIMHSTHKFFLSERSLYILVLDGRKDAKVEYWLKHIEALGGNSPVLVVINKLDLYPQASVDDKSLKEKYNNIKDIYKVSCLDCKNIDELKEGVIKYISEMDNLKTEWPENWVRIKNELENLNCNYITYAQYAKLCERNELLDKNTQEGLLGYLDNLGVVCSFSSWNLKDTKVLNPKWITNGVYKIITSEKIKKNNGNLNRFEIDEIINKQCDTKEYQMAYSDVHYTYNGEEQKYILSLMEKFELSYALDGDNELIPSLLNDSAPEYDFDTKNALQFKFVYKFLPKSIIHRFIVRAYNKVVDSIVWNTGVIIQYSESDTKALVKLDEEDRTIYIYIMGKFRRELLAYIREQLKEINDDFKFKHDEIEEYIIKDRFPISYKNILGHYKNGMEKIFIGEIEKSYSVHELLGDIQTNEYTDKDLRERGINMSFNINNSSQNHNNVEVRQDTSVRTEINIDLKIELPALQTNFSDLSTEVKGKDDKLDKELENLEDNLLSVTPKSDESKVNKCLNKLSIFLKKIEDENSDFHKIIKGTKKGIEYAQKLAKTYNKIAQWAMLPQVPDIFLK